MESAAVSAADDGESDAPASGGSARPTMRTMSPIEREVEMEVGIGDRCSCVSAIVISFRRRTLPISPLVGTDGKATGPVLAFRLGAEGL